MSARVLVVYASTHGHTAKIADRIGEGLRERGVSARVREVGTPGANQDPAGFGGVIVGASVHLHHHQPAVIDWLSEHRTALNARVDALDRQAPRGPRRRPSGHRLHRLGGGRSLRRGLRRHEAAPRGCVVTLTERTRSRPTSDITDHCCSSINKNEPIVVRYADKRGSTRSSWLTQRRADDVAARAGQGIEQADGVDGWAIVKMHGDLDLCSSPELQSVLAGLLHTRRPTILDLSAVRFIDCRGLGVVLWAAGAAQAEGWSFITAAVRA
jgi:anti-anti-sigma factor